MNTNIINNLKETINKSYIDPSIKCIVLSGSSCLPFINNFNDIDIDIFIEDDSRLHMYEIIDDLRNKLETIDSRVAVFPEFVNKFFNKPKSLEIADQLRKVSDRMVHPSLPIYCYQWKWNIILYGDPSLVFPNWDVLGDIQEDWLKNCLYWLTKWETKKDKTFKRIKYLYHIITGLYIIENNSYDVFTDEQIKNINIAHDKADGWEELFQWAKSKVKILLNI